MKPKSLSKMTLEEILDDDAVITAAVKRGIREATAKSKPLIARRGAKASNARRPRKAA